MKEISLKIGNYNREERYDTKVSTALHIMNIIMSERGKGHPNFPDIGVGIENYEFTRDNPSNLLEIEDKIKFEISRVLPHIGLHEVKCVISTGRVNYPFLRVDIVIDAPIENINKEKTILLRYEFQKIKNKTIPKIYI